MSCKIIISRSDCKGADVITYDDTMIASALYKILKSIDGARIEDPEAVILAYKADEKIAYHFAADTKENMKILAEDIALAIDREVSEDVH